MNAEKKMFCHRQLESNGTVSFYDFSVVQNADRSQSLSSQVDAHYASTFINSAHIQHLRTEFKNLAKFRMLISFILHPFCINACGINVCLLQIRSNNNNNNSNNSRKQNTIIIKTNRFLKLTIRNFNRIVTNDPHVSNSYR